MLIIISQVVLLLVAIALPLKSRKEKELNRTFRLESRRIYRIDTDTSNANYAINEFGTLEKINRLNWDHQSEIEN